MKYITVTKKDDGKKVSIPCSIITAVHEQEDGGAFIEIDHKNHKMYGVMTEDGFYSVVQRAFGE